MKGNLTNSSEMSSSTTLKPPLPSPTALNDDLAFVSGSTVERQAYARHYKNQNVQDYDIMVVHGFISSPTALIQTSIPGFKQILFEPIQKLGSLSCLTGTLNSTGQLCLNGLQMKMYHKVKNETPFVVDSAGIVTTTDKTDLTAIVTHTSTTDSTAASVAVTVTREPLPFENDLTQILPNWLHHQQPLSVPTHVLKERFYKFSRGYMDAISHYTLPLLINEHVREMATEWNTNEQRFYDLLNIIGPVYGYRLPQKIKQQLQLIFDFYDKHKHLAHSSKIKETIDYVNYCLPKEIDLVPAIQIKGFWPDDVQPFLERFRKNCPHLYNELISKTSMHLIAKWSKKTSAIDQELEFRYSFSALERLLADKRTQNEQILNGIARSIYYRYLTKTSGSNLIPSYFVKTTVLWMCETMSDLINNIVGDNAESIARQLGFEWIKFATKQLREGICLHYFIENLNILKYYRPELLVEACDILEYKVKLDEIVRLEFMEIHQQMVKVISKNTEQFVRQMKLTDLIQAINDYYEMSHVWWSSASDDNNNSNNDIPVQSCLTILNTLACADSNQSDWKIFRQLIFRNEQMEEENEQDLPVWGENVSIWGPKDFVENLIAAPFLLKSTHEILNSDTFTGRCPEYNPFDIKSFQNVAQDIMNPDHLKHVIISTFGPLFTNSLFGIDQNRMEQVLKSFFQRSLTQDQGIGPQLNLQVENVHSRSNQSLLSGDTTNNDSNRLNFEHDSYEPQQLQRRTQQCCSRCFTAHFMNLLQQAPSKDMTIGDYIDHEQKLIEEQHKQAELDDDLMAHVLQESLNDQQDAEQLLLLNFEEHNNQQLPSNDVTVEEPRVYNGLLISDSEPFLNDTEQTSNDDNQKQKVTSNEIYVDEEQNKEVELDNNDLSTTMSSLKLSLVDQQVESWDTQTQESTNSQQQVFLNNLTVTEQCLIDEQNIQAELDNDERLARALQLSFDDEHNNNEAQQTAQYDEDHLLALVLQSMDD